MESLIILLVRKYVSKIKICAILKFTPFLTWINLLHSIA